MTATIDKVLIDKLAALDADQKESVLGYIIHILSTPATDDEFSIDDYNRELDEAEAEIARGEFSTNENVFENSKKLIDARKKA
jgi:predicted S18 family serine protease